MLRVRHVWPAAAFVLFSAAAVAQSPSMGSGAASAGGLQPSSTSPLSPVKPLRRSLDPKIQKLDREAEIARQASDDRLRRRDAAARRSLQGICKGC